MKNSSSLIIVLCVLVAVGCRCYSNYDNYGDSNSTPTPLAYPTPSPTANSSTDRDTAENRSRNENLNRSSDAGGSTRIITGTYTGKAQNTTYNQRGDILLRIDSVDSDGEVRGYFEASNGLQGKADLKGTIDGKGKLSLSGTLADGQSLAVAATVEGDKISGGYGLADTKLRTQQGNFTVTRR